MQLTGLWRDRDFVRFWSAGTISVFGTLITRTAIPYTAILTLGATPLQLSALTIAELAPGFLIGLAAGAWIDRRRRRPVMIAADLGRMAVLLSIPVAALTGMLTMTHLLIAALLISIFNVTFDIASQAYLPVLVPRETLVDANSKISAAGSVAEALSFGSGGWLVQALTAPVAIGIDAVTFLASAFFLRSIRKPEPAPIRETTGDDAGERTASLFREAAAGVGVVWRDPLLRALVGSNAGMSLGMGLIGVLFMYYVTEILGFSPGVLGMIFALGGIGSLLAAIAAGRMHRLPVGPVMIVSLALVAVGQLLLPLATSAGVVGLTLLVAQQFVSDPAWTIYEINQVSVRQGLTSDHVLGRVNAVARVSEVGAEIVGALAAGFIAAAFDARTALFVGAGAFVAAALWLFVSPARSLRSVPVRALVDDPGLGTTG